jgi:hypothetical protein
MLRHSKHSESFFSSLLGFSIVCSSFQTGDEVIELFHLRLCASETLRPGADAGLNIFGLGHDIDQIFFVFLERKTTSLARKPRDDFDGPRRLTLPLFYDFELYPMSAALH